MALILKKNGNIDHSAHEALRHGIARSTHWPAVEREFVKANPLCAVCANPKSAIQAHHIFPFHYCIALGRPDLELDFRNLISLCETEKGKPAQDHHLLIGHLDNFKSSNVSVINDTVIFHGMSMTEIEASDIWLVKKNNKLKLLDEMSDVEKSAFRALMDSTFPLAA